MERQVKITADGSYTLYLPEWDEHYHSKFGAYTESMHIFVNNGFHCIDKDEISVLEIGFGTGLNAILTFQEAIKNRKKVVYETVEKYPVTSIELEHLAFKDLIDPENQDVYLRMHQCEWDKEFYISENFIINKKACDLIHFRTKRTFDVIYFDAFAPDLQPTLWSEEVFAKMYDLLNQNGILVTYSTKGIVKRAMKSIGFEIHKFEGPEGGKRECLKGVKNGCK